MEHTNIIYIAGTEGELQRGWVKVGITDRDINERIKQATEQRERYELYWHSSTPYYKELEKAVHNEFENQKEWVKASVDEVVEFIDDHILTLIPEGSDIEEHYKKLRDQNALWRRFNKMRSLLIEKANIGFETLNLSYRAPVDNDTWMALTSIDFSGEELSEDNISQKADAFYQRLLKSAADEQTEDVSREISRLKEKQRNLSSVIKNLDDQPIFKFFVKGSYNKDKKELDQITEKINKKEIALKEVKDMIIDRLNNVLSSNPLKQ